MNRSRIVVVLAGLCTLLFGAGLLRLLLGRFELGDVYPAYSSLRTDPLGCRALYDALGTVPGVSVERFLRRTAELPGGRAACLLLPGAQPTLAASAPEVADLEGFLASGGRLVLALDLRRGGKDAATAGGATDSAAAGDPREPAQKARASLDPPAPPSAPAPPETPPPDPGPRRRSPVSAPATATLPTLTLARQWGYGYDRGTVRAGPDQPAAAALADDTQALPAMLPWPGTATLVLHDPRWLPVYTLDGRPVVAQRRIGLGTLVLIADSYLLSNQGLRDAAQPSFVSWLLGPSQRILFDETHLGIEQQRGIMLLARQYGLHGVFMAVAMLALLFVWQSSGRLAPPPPAPQADADAVTGRAAGSALSDLLRRHLRAHELPAACVLAWGRTAALPRALLERHLERLHDRVRAYRAAPRRQRDAVACYRDLCEIIAKKEAPPCKTPPPA